MSGSFSHFPVGACPSLVPLMVSLGPSAPSPPLASALLTSASGFPLAPPAPLSSFLSSGAPGLPSSSSGISVGPIASASGVAPPSDSRGSGFEFAGAYGALSSHDDPFLYHDFDDSLVKGGEGFVRFG